MVLQNNNKIVKLKSGEYGYILIMFIPCHIAFKKKFDKIKRL